MLRVGLTGGIGSGKSTVARMWRDLGACIVDADRVARRILSPGSRVLARVVETFGREILGQDGELDRKKLAELVFGDPAALARLNEIVHPEVIRRIDEMISRDRAGGAGIYVVEAALILECGRREDYDVLVVVDAGLEACVDRVIRDRGISREQVMKIAGSQMRSDLKRTKADFVISNEGSIEELREEAVRVYRELQVLEERTRVP